MLLAWAGPASAALDRGAATPAPAVRPMTRAEWRVLTMPATLRSAPSVDAPVAGTLALGTPVAVEARTADGAFLRVRAGDGPAGWIWAPLARPLVTPAAEDAAKTAAVAAPAEDRPAQLARYRERLHAAETALGLDPLGPDTAAAIGLFRDVTSRVTAAYVRPVDLGELVGAAIAGLERPDGRPATPQALVMASLRPALARLDQASTLLTSAELAAMPGPVAPAAEERPAVDAAEDEGPGGRILLFRPEPFQPGEAEVIRRWSGEHAPDGPAAPAAVVLDLRGHGGGRLDEAVAFADLFLAGGEIGRFVAREPRLRSRYFAKPDAVLAGVPMVVVVDEGTSSGAELVAGALQAAGRALLVGRPTDGAAAVQTVMPLRDDLGALRLTTGRLALAGGREFACRGLEPDVRLGRPRRAPIGEPAPGRAGCGGRGGGAVGPGPAPACPGPGGGGGGGGPR